MTALDIQSTDKLARICGLFGSDHDGERASAAAMADKIVRARGLTWSDVLTSVQPRTPNTIRDKIRLAQSHMDLLSLWERGFIYGVERKAKLSDKQIGVLDEIVAKIGGGA